MRGIPKIVMTASAAVALFALSACGSTDNQRTATGAGSGALAGAVVGGPVGAVVGGGVGAVAGNSMDESLGKKTDRLTNQAAKEIDERTDGTSSTSSRRGSSAMGHDRVRAIQEALNERNSGSDIAVDGKWGPGTRRALIEFQRNNGLTATGRADRETMAALNLSGHQGTSGTTRTQNGTPSSGTSGSMQNGTGTMDNGGTMNNNGMPSGSQTDNKAGSNQ
ncbi:peptidoglycan-binding domain-containing protein [Azospirillum picis]|uniref:Peptidoglycan hydrolase-like protein with peptidoglycan-binding domain n=1 Tax=Azospirillum picis TaxID=488438 RepID=A0ABU0MLL0_9PROT|nr:peptidoglycan-binding domain-containing protein [Azospirillum picis]MBP2301028.1 peptidoglycan hydrolase-like protein with peptidoglycan-binding domain [Azospirillum picis]MDQ0534352.1 peptidoglycan hydrolase-like protein with peptidoglycan-binding domain [Azospirillum picis]